MFNLKSFTASALAVLLTLSASTVTHAESKKPISPKSVPPLVNISQVDKRWVGKQVSFVGTVFDATCSSTGLTYQLVDDSGGIFVTYGAKVYDAIPHVDGYAVGSTVRITGTVVQGKTKLLISVAHADDTTVLTSTQRVVPLYQLGGLSAADYNTHMQIDAEIYRVDPAPQGLDLIVFDKTGARQVHIASAVLNRFAQRDNIVAGAQIRFVGQVKIAHRTRHLNEEKVMNLSQNIAYQIGAVARR